MFIYSTMMKIMTISPARPYMKTMFFFKHMYHRDRHEYLLDFSAELDRTHQTTEFH